MKGGATVLQVSVEGVYFSMLNTKLFQAYSRQSCAPPPRTRQLSNEPLPQCNLDGAFYRSGAKVGYNGMRITSSAGGSG
jgi:hypothetical protein